MLQLVDFSDIYILSTRKMLSRTIYCNLKWDGNKKKAYFGGKWGAMDKSEANTIAYKTGNGLIVVDVDTQDLDEIDKRVGDELKKLAPTVTTKRGYHYYFWHKKSKEFVNDSAYTELVDVRSDGGIIFAQYRGKDTEHISYKKTGKIYKKIPKKLYKILLKLRVVKTRNKKSRDRWSKAPKGEIHSATLSYAAKDFHSGLSFDEVMLRGVEYVENYLGGTPREMKLMSRRIKDAYEYWKENRLKEAKEVEDIEDTDFSEDEVLGMLLMAQKKGALELEKTMKTLKKKTKISMGTMRNMLDESLRGGDNLSAYFKGNIIWDNKLNVFAEVRDECIIHHNKSGFTQTVMSKSGFMKPQDVTDRLSKIPNKCLVYAPDVDDIEFKDEFGNDCVNSYRGIKFDAVGHKIPKLIDKLLNNLFVSDMAAKNNFIHWLAYILQFKKRTNVAWGFYGASGTGKGLLVDIIYRLLGLGNCSINVGDVSLQSNFNSYAYNKLFIHLNEIASDYHSRHGVAGKIKALVSDDVIQINMKGVSEISQRNYCNLILNSNNPNPIEIDTTDRRWNLINCNSVLAELDWFTVGVTGDKIISKYKKFGEYLMNLKVDKFKATHIMTRSKTKENLMLQTSNPLKIVGDMMVKGECKNIEEYLGLTDKNFEIDLKELEKSCETGFWRVSIISNIYTAVTGNEVKNNVNVAKYFVKPFLTASKSILKNKVRYYKI